MSDRRSGLLEQLKGWPVKNYACFVLDIATGSEDVFGEWGKAFKWASVSKLASALGMLSAVSEGVFMLDEILSNGSVLSDVLAHASGLATEIDDSADIFSQRPVIPPRTKRIYSNSGFELLAASLEVATGFSFKDYLSEVLFEVAGMDTAVISGDLWPNAGSRGAAAGVLGSLKDLFALARALIFGTPFVDVDLLKLAKAPYLPELSGILPGFGEMTRNYWGLGIEVKGDKFPHWTSRLNSPTTFGHFGAAGTFLWIDPERNLAVGVLTDKVFGPWAQKAWPELSSYIVEAY
ncbi:MAG: serine hydrolase [Actinomycetota bacterium]|nr:serine hydrolase [Actinomycetota bacterium]